MSTIRITEIFLSLQGEAMFTGVPSVFIRTTGCPLRCSYCDTAYAFSGGKKHSIDEIVAQTKSYQVSHVTVTGGEPLAQPNTIALLESLVQQKFIVALETSGALDISQVPPGVHKIIDLKTPDSGEEHRNLYANLDLLSDRDQIKFVICSRSDYEWAVEMLARHKLNMFCEVLFSPSYGQQGPTELAEFIIADRLPVRFQMQLHKLLWGDEKGR